MKARALTVNLAVALGSLLFIAFVSEVALRLVLGRGLNPFLPDPVVGFRLKSDFDGLYPRVSVRTDGHGRRIPGGQEGDATGRWLFLGDSVTFGFGVPAGDAFPWRWASLMGDRAGATVAAVPGYNLEQALVLGRENAALATPELVVFGLVINDPTGAAHPATYQDIDPHAASSARGGLLGRSMLVAFIQRRVRRIADSFDPPPERAAELSRFQDLESELAPTDLEAFDRQWRDLERFQRELDRPVYVLICPYRQQVEGDEPNEALQRFAQRRCEAGRLTCLDPLPLFRERAAEGLFNGASSYHYNALGHDLVAQWLFATLPSEEGSP